MSDHQNAIKANLASFDKQMTEKYEKRDSHKLLSILFIKHLLEFNFQNRKSLIESEKILGDPNLPLNGYTIKDLPDPQTYLSNYPDAIIKPGIKVLDFACGPGIVTELLIPYLNNESELIGMDINPYFLDSYNQKAKSQSLKMVGYQYDILDESIQSELKQFENHFDVIICTISYHHIANYETVTKKLTTFLKEGGWLFIIDFYNEDVEKAGVAQNEAVQHMGGLKIDKLNHVLGDYSNLINVSSAREFRVWLWQPESFILNHMNECVIEDLKNGKLKSKDDEIDGKVYLIPASVIYAVGQK